MKNFGVALVLGLTCPLFLHSSFCAPIEVKTLLFKDYLQKIKVSDPEYERLQSRFLRNQWTVDQGLPASPYLLEAQSLNGFGGASGNTNQLNTGISKKLLSSGTQLSADYTTNKTPGRNEKLTEFRLRQSLLKDAFGSQLRLKKDALQIRQQAEELALTEEVEKYLSDKIKIYLDYSQSAADLDFSERSYKEAQKLYRFTRNKFDKQAANQTDLRRSRLQMLLREEELLRKQADYDQLNQKVHLMIGFSELAYRPEKELDLSKKYGSKNIVFASDKLRALRSKELLKDAAYSEIFYGERFRFPELELIAGYDIDRSTRFSTQVSQNQWILGLALSYPLGDSQSTAERKIAKFDFQAAEHDTHRVQRDLQDSSINILQRLQKLRRRVEIGQEKLDLMEKIMKEELRRYQIGRLELNRIIEANDDLVRYQSQYSQDRIQYNRVTVDWLELNDQLH